MTVSQVSAAYQTERSTIHGWVKRHESGGFDGLYRSKAPGSGRPKKLAPEEQAALLKVVCRDASEFGYETDLWTCRRVMQFLRKVSRIRVSRQDVWGLLHDTSFSFYKPER